MNLFADAGRRRAGERAPLAERLRPDSLAALLGQDEILADGALLRAEIASGRLSSLLLWGPPGCGKTTLARLIARESRHELVALSAVSSGVADLRRVLSAAEERLAAGRPTLLFVDEIHRFHKGQQDALLHQVEDGRVVLVGATTENPSFHVNAALLSRCRVVRLAALESSHLGELVRRALADPQHGLGALGVELDPDGGAIEALVSASGGDARRLLNHLEQAVRLVEASMPAGESGRVASGLLRAEHVERARGALVARHDKAGDAHYDLLSALHKALRGSDPDAAAYYVQRMLVAGEDPTVVARRLVRMASEDIGLADPAALGVALSALEAVRFLGLPEGDAALVQAAVYLALAPKSDAIYRACRKAREAVERTGSLPVPLDLRNAPDALAQAAGHGRGYVNPHGALGKLTPQLHLPEALARETFYEPTRAGAEAALAERLAELRSRRAAARREAREAARPPRRASPGRRPTGEPGDAPGAAGAGRAGTPG